MGPGGALIPPVSMLKDALGTYFVKIIECIPINMVDIVELSVERT